MEVRTVNLAGQEPVVLGFVETRRPDDEIWVRFEAAAPAVDDDSSIPAECYWLHVPESCILGIEVSYRRAGTLPVGFRIEERDE